jgi:hypothetical protein
METMQTSTGVPGGTVPLYRALPTLAMLEREMGKKRRRHEQRGKGGGSSRTLKKRSDLKTLLSTPASLASNSNPPFAAAHPLDAEWYEACTVTNRAVLGGGGGSVGRPAGITLINTQLSGRSARALS